MKRTSKKRKLKNKKSEIIIISAISLCLFFIMSFLAVNIFKGKVFEINATKIANDDSSVKNITISAIGDIMAHDDQLKAQFDKDTNTYSFDNNFKYVKPYISNSDLAIGNLETTLAGPKAKYSSFPKFNSPDELADAIKDSGVDIVSTINNHTYDRGSDGVYRTLDVLNSKDIEHVGTQKNDEDENFLIKDVDGVKLGITAYSYGQVYGSTTALNGLNIDYNDLNNLNIFNSSYVDIAFNEIKDTLDVMNNKESDLQVVILHWGDEYTRQPNEFQKELAKKLCDYGVDIIIGSHPHMVQPIEMIKSDENDNETLVIYSLGNFLSNQRNEILNKKYTEDGVIANIGINKNLNTGETKISNVEYIPTWVNKYNNKNGKLTYEIIPLINEKQFSKIDNLPLDKAKKSYDNTTSIIGSSDIINVAK
ncbi:CapA family protein [Paraclostridium bifermentans]|uniref:CapA family protein n=1 Tax=Paraclostridium bifermentans TaxID=1490 RepID=UPI00041E340A|nr:CapA family protein [Paraclostridium bifermentans]TQO58723.1 CapA family protein [Paraclostridium bifermentans]GKZ02223.1 capsule biosynthesis protein [Paraclostridium bifermentans]GKZ07967.1 capsule biosynthesis protein [Paraclostridium bifermentans]GKZ10899.1 capsule biosynthesis protein [Paraclostridium bifermentans]